MDGANADGHRVVHPCRLRARATFDAVARRAVYVLSRDRFAVLMAGRPAVAGGQAAFRCDDSSLPVHRDAAVRCALGVSGLRRADGLPPARRRPRPLSRTSKQRARSCGWRLRFSILFRRSCSRFARSPQNNSPHDSMAAFRPQGRPQVPRGSVHARDDEHGSRYPRLRQRPRVSRRRHISEQAISVSA